MSDINKVNDDLPECEESLLDKSRKFYQDQRSNIKLDYSTESSQEIITKKSSAVVAEEDESLVDGLHDVLDLTALPNNRPTRLLQDYRGSSFSIRGYIKFICSNGQYKKIYENMIGNPRKDYRVTLILDVSKSMAGMAEVGTTKVILAFAGKFFMNEIFLSLLSVPY